MSRHTLCNCPVGFSAAPERHAPDCPGRSGAGKRPRITHERFQELMGNRSHVTEADREVIRIRAAMALSDFDKEDLITYAKEVVSLRAALAALKALSAENQRVIPVEPLLAPPHPLDVALKAGQGEAVATISWQQPSCEWTLNMLCEPAVGEGVDVPLYFAPPASADAVLVSRYQLTRALDQLNRLGYGNISYVRELRALLAQSESKG